MAKGRGAGGYDGRANLIPMNRRTEIDQKRIATMGGKASGEARRKKADFRRVLNQILTMQVPDDVMRQQLQELGLEGDMQTALNATMVRQALAGSVKAAEYVAKYSGQAATTEREDRAQDADIRAKEAAAQVREEQAATLKREREKTKEEKDIDDSASAMQAFFMSQMAGGEQP